MNEILKIFLSLSLSGSLLILVLLLCRPLFKNKVSKSWQYYIWLVVIIRMLLPFAPETSPIGSLFQTIDNATIQIDTADSPEQDIVSSVQSANTMATENDAVSQQEELSTDITSLTKRIFAGLMRNLWLAWLVVALILMIRKITIYQDFIKYIKAGHMEISNTALLDRLAIIGKQSGVKKPVELYTNSLISSPILIGFFRPCIVLPTADLLDADFQYTILHELTHYKRRDMFYKWLIQFTICLHWFNPLVYVMVREVGRMCELACDEAVIKTLDAKGRQDYGNTLINAIGIAGNYKDTLASVTLNESKNLLKERLEAIMVYRKKTKLIVFITLVLTMSLIYGATAMGAYAISSGPTFDKEAKQIDSESKSTEDEYLKWKIKKKKDAYYYRNQRVRIFMDMRADRSFENFNYDELGKIDLRLVRAQDNTIEKVGYLPKAEVKKILKDLDIKQKEDGKIKRLSKKAVSKEVLNVINSCETGTWYAIVDNRYQYIYYRNMPHNYAWTPKLNKKSAAIDIFDLGKSSGTYVLLKVPKNLKLTIHYNSKKVKYTKVHI